MVMRHRAALDRLAGFLQCQGEILMEKGELALCLQGQSVSVELVALPIVQQAGHGDHVIVRLFPVGIGSLQVATQRVDTRAERDEKSGLPNSFS